MGACRATAGDGRASPGGTESQGADSEFDFRFATKAEFFRAISPPEEWEFDAWVVGPKGVVLTVEGKGGTVRRLDYHRFNGGEPMTLATWRPYGEDNDDWQIRGLTDRYGLLQFITDSPSLRWELKRIDLQSGERVDFARSDEHSDAEPIISATLRNDLIVWVQRNDSDDPCLLATPVESIQTRRILCASEFGKVIVAHPFVGDESLLFVATAKNGAGRGYEVPLDGGEPVEVAKREGTATIEKVGNSYLTYWVAPSVEPDPIDGRNGVFVYINGSETRVQPQESHSPVACGRWAIWTGLVGRAGRVVQGIDPRTKETVILVSPEDGSYPSFSTCHDGVLANIEHSGEFDSPVHLFMLPK